MRDRGRSGLSLYPSCLTPDQVGLSAYFRDVANQKPLTVRCFGGFRLPFLKGSTILMTKQPDASKPGAYRARDSSILHCITLSKHFSYG